MIKLNIKAVLETAVGVVVGVGLLGVGALIANRLFGIYAYPHLTSQQVDTIAKQYDSRFRIVTRACDSTHCRGIYDMGGSLYYYSWEKGKSYTIYPLFYERYSTDISFGDKPPLVFP